MQVGFSNNLFSSRRPSGALSSFLYQSAEFELDVKHDLSLNPTQSSKSQRAYSDTLQITFAINAMPFITP